MAAYGEKGLSLFLRPEKTQGFLKNIPAYLHCCCPQYMRILKNVTWRKKLRGFEFFLHGASWAKNG